MMYKSKHRKYKILSLLIICSSLIPCTSFESYAEDDGRPVPLQVYVPNISSLPKYFSAKKIEYNMDSFTLTAKGKVEIDNGDTVVNADMIEYDQLNNIVKARGNVIALYSSGKVDFANEMELKSQIKDSVIRSFQIQLANNEAFIEAESEIKKARQFTFQKTPVVEKSSFFGRMFSYFSPSQPTAIAAIAQPLSNLEPAAGEADSTGDAPVIGSVPLLNIPEANAKTPADPKPTEVAVEEKPVTTQSTATVSEKNAESQISEPPKIEDKPQTKTEIPTEKKPEKIKSEVKKPDSSGKKSTVKNLAKKEDSGKTAVEDKKGGTNEIKPMAAASEPTEELSPKSKELLEKVSPAAIVASKIKNPSPKPVDVSHTRSMQDLFKASDTVNNGGLSESLGVKIDRKNQNLNPDYELEKAYNAINAGQSEAAMEIYKNILANAPNNTQALFGLATLYHRVRQLDKARPLYGRLLAVDPNNRDGFNNFLVLLADEAPNEALKELEKLEEKNPGFSTIPAQLAVIYQKLGEQDKATGKMFRAVALAPENLTYRYNLAIMLDKQKNYEEAAKLYTQLLEAVQRGEKIPGNVENIQQRLTFISSNRP